MNMPRLLCFDMDSTLIECEMVARMAELSGRGAEVAEMTRQAMEGREEFNHNLLRRVNILKGLGIESIERLAASMPVRRELPIVLNALRSSGYIPAIIGGIGFFSRRLAAKAGIPYLFTTELELDASGKLTGRVIGSPLSASGKAQALRVLARSLGIPRQAVAAVGDGANDIEMLRAAHKAVAFRPKPGVAEASGAILCDGSLLDAIKALGIPI